MRWRFFLSACFLGLTFAVFVRSDGDEIGKARAQGRDGRSLAHTTPPEPLRFDEIAGAGHHALFRADGEPIKLSRAAIEQLPDSMLAALSTPMILGGSDAEIDLVQENNELAAANRAFFTKALHGF